MTAATVYGPFPAGSTGTVSILTNKFNDSLANIMTVHEYRGNVYYTVVHST